MTARNPLDDIPDNVVPMYGNGGPGGPGGLPQSVEDDSTHHEIAVHWLSKIPGLNPATAEGKMWTYTEDLWREFPHERIETSIGSMYQTKNCKKKGDYKALGQHAQDICHDPKFFENAPVGLMTPSGFYVARDSKVIRTDASAELRQRFAVDIVPKHGPMPIWESYLNATFAHPDPAVTEQQKTLLQEVIGTALIGSLFTLEKAVLFYGLQHAGKSTLLRIIEAMVPSEFICAVSPYEWGKEYSLANLSGKRINIIGELPQDVPIPADRFKTVTGRDRVTGRNPYGRPFDFISQAAHFFNTNYFPQTRDQHGSFWRRWVCIGFFNIVRNEDRKKDLDKQIIDAELPAVLYWALQGAARVAHQGLSESAMHDDIMDLWKVDTDTAAQFVRDDEVTEQGENYSVVRGEFYQEYRAWCKDNERRPLGRNKFLGRVENMGFQIGPRSGVYYVNGIKLR